LGAGVRARLKTQVEPHAHLMRDEAKAFMAMGETFATRGGQLLQPRIRPGRWPAGRLVTSQ
jgi:hypothetical protein